MKWKIMLAVLGIALVLPTLVEGQKKTARRDLKELKAKYDALLEKDFMSRIKWHTKFKTAYKEAKKKKLPLLAYFTRSDKSWPPCQETEEKTMLAEWWIQGAERFVPYINVDTGGLNLPEESLRKNYLKGKWYPPWILLIDTRGEVINRFRLENEEVMERHLGVAEELVQLRATVKKNKKDKVAKAHLILLEGMRAKKPNMRALAKAARTEGLGDDILYRFKNFADELPVREVLQEYDEESRKESNQDAEAGKKLKNVYSEKMYDLYKKRNVRLTDTSSDLHARFWNWTFRGALLVGDRETVIKAFETYRKAYGNHERYKGDIRRMKDRMRKM